MQNYYQILGVSSAATPEELRRAYRILARRYHPDVNPGKSSEEKFKSIAEAYAMLQDPVKRKAFDHELDKAHAESFASSFDKAHEAYRRQQGFEHAYEKAKATRKTPPWEREPQPRRTAEERGGANSAAQPGAGNPVNDPLGPGPGGRLANNFFDFVSRSQNVLSSIKGRIPPIGRGRRNQHSEPPPSATPVSQISIIEVSVSVLDAIKGLKKAVEINDGTSVKKISVTIPAGVRSGSVVRFRRREGGEEVVLIVRVASHPILSIAPKGLVMEIPITVKEAVQGARIKVPTLEEATTVFVEPGTQSGTEIRLRSQGVQYRDGTKGDLFVRLMIRVPESLGAVGLSDTAEALEKYHEKPVRQALPQSILDM